MDKTSIYLELTEVGMMMMKRVSNPRSNVIAAPEYT